MPWTSLDPLMFRVVPSIWPPSHSPDRVLLSLFLGGGAWAAVGRNRFVCRSAQRSGTDGLQRSLRPSVLTKSLQPNGIGFGRDPISFKVVKAKRCTAWKERERPQKVLNLVVLFDNGCAIGHSRGPLDLPMRSAMIGYLRWNIRSIPPSPCGIER